MSTTTKRSTIYFDPVLHRALRVKAAETSRSVSDLVNDAVRENLSEDGEDLAAFDERSTEPLVSYEDMLKRLRADGRI
ncbi:MAG: CopG family transcriptional regulator [Planctomycetota bacterium]